TSAGPARTRRSTPRPSTSRPSASATTSRPLRRRHGTFEAHGRLAALGLGPGLAKHVAQFTDDLARVVVDVGLARLVTRKDTAGNERLALAAQGRKHCGFHGSGSFASQLIRGYS